MVTLFLLERITSRIRTGQVDIMSMHTPVVHGIHRRKALGSTTRYLDTVEVEAADHLVERVQGAEDKAEEGEQGKEGPSHFRIIDPTS